MTGPGRSCQVRDIPARPGTTGLSDAQIEKYSRQVVLSEIGAKGQRKLLSSSVLAVGAGGLGSPSLLYLAAAGVGRIGIADGDSVEVSNLHRQIAHGAADIGRNKASSAADALRRLNPDCEVSVYGARATSANIRPLVRGWDVVLDGSDNFPTRFLVADSCRVEKVPLVSAAVVRFDGQLMTVLPGVGDPCYRCLVSEAPEEPCASCSDLGVLGAAAGVMGTLQAVEALKVLLGVGEMLSSRLLVYDALRCAFALVNRATDPECPMCRGEDRAEEFWQSRYSNG